MHPTFKRAVISIAGLAILALTTDASPAAGQHAPPDSVSRDGFQDFVLEEFTTEQGDYSGRHEPGVPRHRREFVARLRVELPVIAWE